MQMIIIDRKRTKKFYLLMAMQFFSIFFLLISALMFHTQRIEAHPQEFLTIPSSRYVSTETWEQVKEFLMPDDHPIKNELDQIFSSSRAFCNMESMLAAGFDAAIPQHHTHILVTRHPHLPGYVIKAYLDEQAYHEHKPEHYFWCKRATGARLIREFIETHDYQDLFKVPRKWIYLLPDEPSPPSDYLRKVFILVEEDMDIFGDKENERVWGSQRVTKKLLKALYTITTDLGLFDCAKPANCPFSRDGRVAFVDTQSFHRGYVKYNKLTPYLSKPMRVYWKKLIKNKGKA